MWLVWVWIAFCYQRSFPPTVLFAVDSSQGGGFERYVITAIQLSSTTVIRRKKVGVWQLSFVNPYDKMRLFLSTFFFSFTIPVTQSFLQLLYLCQKNTNHLTHLFFPLPTEYRCSCAIGVIQVLEFDQIS